MARHDSYIDHLREVPLFAKLTNKELNEVAQLSTELSFSPGQELMTEGGRASSFVVIIQGRAKVVRGGRDIAVLGPGDFAGELALLQNRERNATVMADDELTALVIDRRAFVTLLEDIPSITLKLLFAVAERLGDIDNTGIH